MPEGLLPPAMKKENGARFKTPERLIVLTNAIGLGCTKEVSSA
jgi:hypothetical protein